MHVHMHACSHASMCKCLGIFVYIYIYIQAKPYLDTCEQHVSTCLSKLSWSCLFVALPSQNPKP